MFIVRFVSGDLSGRRATRDFEYTTKREAVAAIPSASYKPGPKVMENGVCVRLAHQTVDAKKQ